MDITRKEFDAESKEFQVKLIEAGVTVIEEKGLTDVEVKTITDQAFAPIQKQLDEMTEKQTKFFENAAKKDVEIDHNEIAGIQFKRIAGKRLDVEEKAVLATFANSESGDTSGGENLVDTAFVKTLTQVAIQDDAILGRIKKFTLGKGFNSLELPTAETTPFAPAGTGKGITAYWAGATTPESIAKTQSRPVFSTITLNLEKIFCFTPVTDTLLEDSAIDLAGYVQTDQVNKIRGELLRSIITDGSDQGNIVPLVTAGCRIVTNRATAGTVEFADVLAMYTNMLPSSLAAAVWIGSPKVKGAIYNLSDDAGNLIFMNKGVAGSPENTLFGQPYLETMYSPALGDTGDLMFVDLEQYVMATKSVKSDSSIHFYFDQDVTCFRSVMRVAGQIWLSDTLSNENTEEYTYVAVLGPTTGS